MDITKQQMNDRLESKKGWICNRSGNEYIYDFHLSKQPIIIKVSSSVRIDADRSPNKGSHAIRIFAVRKAGMDKKAEIVCGLVKATRLNITDNWREELKKAVYGTMQRAVFVHLKQERRKGEF